MSIQRRFMLTPIVAFAMVGLLVPSAAAVSPTGARADQWIAFSRLDPAIGGFALWTARADGSRQHRLTSGQAYFPAWSPDRSQLLFDFPDDQGNEQIGRVDRDGTSFRQLTDLPGISEAADYSPDGKRIIFDRSPTFSPEGFHTSLWVMHADGSHPRALLGANSTTFDVEPKYSPDGSKIVFGRIDPGEDPQQEALFVVDADGSQPRQILRHAVGVEHPRWSPDGRWVIYDIEAGIPADGIYLVRPGGRDRHRVFRSERLVAFKPDFSPDGQHILFGCYVRAQQQEDLCVMRADGTGVHRIVRTPNAFENFPVWA